MTAGSKGDAEDLDLRVLWLREHIRWMGRRSGYAPICDALAAAGGVRGRTLELRVGRRLPPGARAVLRRLKGRARGSPFYNVDSVLAELRVLASAARAPVDVVHLTYVENQLGLLAAQRERLRAALVGTVHQPAGWFRLRHRHVDALACFDALIALGRREASWLEEVAPGRVHHVPYAVDLAHFRPRHEAGGAASSRPRVLFGGRWLRDWDTLVEVVDQVLARDAGVAFDLLVPWALRGDPRLLRIARHAQVRWHADLSDADLLALYQGADLLLLPMVDCVGNSVLLEGIACGLPVVASDVGAIPEYTRADFASLHPVGDVPGMADAVLELVADPADRARRRRAARAYAEAELRWERAAAETLRVYRAAVARREKPA